MKRPLPGPGGYGVDGKLVFYGAELLMDTFELRPIGRVESDLTDPQTAPKQGDEGAPPSRLVLDPGLAPAMRDLRPGTEAVVLTWLDRADRDTLTVHPRRDPSAPRTGVFSTRSPHRPYPIGLHTVRILAVDHDNARIHVADLEAIDGTPILDIKPVLPQHRSHDR
ncbi:tRNA (N6-threonylcarbamoyladenosine(37)-N6)-methyltransferase TrmO [Nocardia vaccinii]|uniref:tRNA (N6-threonylcarbamoyladenosine(37)-N6)-methyltransferase TrmO n=1 Tax=Nocardia vaccinii TaxID=1822 RepID=UPI000B036012|nr:tRNA (N6-threonylcarbamoyladenosine(37)-N6)-methyltransferase TrmO [Nocardia vaccinii]